MRLTLQAIPSQLDSPEVSRCLAFLAGHREERSCFLLYVLAPAMWASDFLLVMLLQGEDGLEGFFAVVADVVVYGHEAPRMLTLG